MEAQGPENRAVDVIFGMTLNRNKLKMKGIR